MFVIFFLASGAKTISSLLILGASVADNGAVIHKIMPNSPAENVLHKGERIVSIDGKTIATTKDFEEVVSKLHPLDTITIKTDISSYILYHYTLKKSI